MFFSELNGAYYNAVAQILKAALQHPVSPREMREIIAQTAFSESVLTIEPALTEGRWQLLRRDGTTPLRHVPQMPPNALQKQWLKAVSLDPRIGLFDFDATGLEDVDPLFTQQDVFVFDKYADGDPYTDAQYIKNFRTVLDAAQKHVPLCIKLKNRSGREICVRAMPQFLEYSEKDDKFRLITAGCRYGETIKLSRIISAEPFEGNRTRQNDAPTRRADRHVAIELLDSRNALERALLHFADFEKRVVRLDDRRYSLTVNYAEDDESEVVIRVLSFGPVLRVTEPQEFVQLIKQRLQAQKDCGAL